jgi:2-polyprenyl-3-methyl-5-hydroxy-6-metoxy-1,4-benzoquinol methylase
MQSIVNDLRHSSCPLCHSSKSVFVGLINYNQAIQFSSEAVKLEKTPELWKCHGCRSAFVQNVLSEDTARQLYSQGDSTSRWSAVVFEEDKPKEIVVELSRLLTNGKQHLDVGCGAGNLLDFSKARGCLTTGLDYSSATRDCVERKGHAWFPSFKSLEVRDFDVITAFDLIEHLYDVRAFIQECCDRLRAGGRLVILTGNIDSLSARIARQHWWYAAYPEHIVFPSVHFFEAYRLERLIPTYAAKAYQSTLIRKLRGVAAGIVRRGCYSGQPALGPDHMLITLRT